MGSVERTLSRESIRDLAAARDAGWGAGLDAADRLGPTGLIEELEASGLRGRGGAGFPTGRKWRTVAANASPTEPATVVVNGAEGEPGAFKDRSLLRADPYRVLEGALIAARAVGAGRFVIAIKASFTKESARMRAAIDEVRADGHADGLDLSLFEGPEHYLYGEETGLLEAIDGRPPFPRVAPPYRHGVEEIGDGHASAAHVEMAAPRGESDAPPTLVSNVETFANVPGIVARGADDFRSVGTESTPGTVICTITGQTVRHGVGEYSTDTPLSQVIEELGGGPRSGRQITAVLSGVAHPLITPELLDTRLDFDEMAVAGVGLGAAGFIVFDDESDLVAVAQGVSRFLAVESCGQCTPCKQDGRAIARHLEQIRDSEAQDVDLLVIADRVRTVADSARCYLAQQHQRVIGSALQCFPEVFRDHIEGVRAEAPPELIAPIIDFDGDRAVLDEHHLAKQPDWTYDEVDSGQAPADRYENETSATIGR
jgi:NADH:ubiquinone oxidoreductase subunit F (NADH-binding)